MILLVPLAFLAALGAAAYAPPGWPVGLAALAPFLVGAGMLVAARRPFHAMLGMAALAAALGLLRADAERLLRPPSALAALMAEEAPVAVRGVIVAPPVERDRAQQVVLRVDAVRDAGGEWSATSGLMQVVALPAPALAYGDVLEARGKVKLPEAGAPAGYAAALRRQAIDATLAFPSITRLEQVAPSPWQALAMAIRAQASAAIEHFLPEPQAALVEGILAGQRVNIPRDLSEAMNRSGTSHITAVSGFNVSVVAGVAIWLLGGRRWRRLWQQALLALAASAATWAFVGLVGASGSVLRAAAMAQLALLGRALGRQGTAGAMLLWGSVALAAWQPATLQDVGWELSFLGTAGLIWLAPPLAAGLRRFAGWLPGTVREPLAATLAAQLGVLPVLAAVFGQVSVVAPLANVLALPLVPPIMLGGALVAVAGAWLPALAPAMAALTWLPAALLTWIVRAAAGVPGAALGLPAWPAWAVVAYLAALVVVAGWSQSRDWTAPAAGPGAGSGGAAPAVRAPVRRGVVAGLAILAALLGVGVAMAQPLLAADRGTAPLVTIAIPDPAEGTLLLAQEAGGARVLVNGGPTTSGAVTLLGEFLRPWDRTVDVVVLTDPREAYALGLVRVLERYRVGLLLDAVDDYPSAPYRQVREVAARRNVPRLHAEPGSELAVGTQMVIEVLGAPGSPGSPGSLGSLGSLGSPGSAGAQGAGARSSAAQVGPVALRLRSGDFSLLLPGDGTAAERRALLASPQALDSTALLLADRTTRQAGAEALLRAASPELVVVQGTPRLSAGAAGSPPPEPVRLAMPEGEPEPGWHSTQEDGPLRLEVRDGEYRVVAMKRPTS